MRMSMVLALLVSFTTLTGPVADADVIGLWLFDEGQGNIARDSSGNGVDGQIHGASYVPGLYKTALEFGGNDYIDLGLHPALEDGIDQAFTVEVWVKTDQAPPADSSTLIAIQAGGPFALGFTSSTGGGLYGYVGATYKITDPDSFPVGEWVHVAQTYDGSTQRLYRNGVAVAVQQVDNGVTHGTDPWTIGAWSTHDDNFLQGVTLDEMRVLNEALPVEELGFFHRLSESTSASAPEPADEALDVPRDVVLGWAAGEFAATHDVYLGTTFDDVNMAGRATPLDVLVSQGQAATAYEPPAVLEFGQTYFWRVDEVNAAPDNEIFRGDLWSFTVEPVGYPIAGVIATTNGATGPGADPANMVNGSGLNENDEHSIEDDDMWVAVPAGAEPLSVAFAFDGLYKLHEMQVWNYNSQFEPVLGFGLKDVTVEYSEDGAAWAMLGEVTLARGTAQADYAANTTIDFGGAVAQYVRLTVSSGYGAMGQYGLSEVRFLHIPVQARQPQPADDQIDVALDAVLSWRGGREAASHDVYLGTDPAALVLIDTVDSTQYAPGDLALGTTYSWRIDEVNEAASPKVWAGNVWSFSTRAFFVVDDFESYDDEENVIYEAWIDGWVNETGSTVGHLEAPFAERALVHEGQQSMPFFYDNTSAATSEGERALASQDWTQAGTTTLVLYFRGDPANSGGQLYVKINGVKVAYEGDADALTNVLWQPWSIDLASVGTDLANVTTLTIGVEGGGSGLIYVDDIRLYRLAPGVTQSGQ